MNSVIVCLDLALANTGIAVVEIRPLEKDRILHVNTLHTDKGSGKVADDEWRRTEELAKELTEVIAKWNPVHIALECPTGGSKSATAARSMAVARGAACAVISGKALKYTLVTPFEAKKAATGDPKAEKDQVKLAVKAEFPEFNDWVKGKRGNIVEGLNEHVYDALSVYMAFRLNSNYKELKGVGYTEQRSQLKNRPAKRKHNFLPLPESKGGGGTPRGKGYDKGSHRNRGGA